MKVIELKKEMDARFDQVDARFTQVDARFATVDGKFVELEERIVTEGERTRRYFDVVAERLQDQIRLVFDKVMAIGDKLDRYIVKNDAEHDGFRGVLDEHDDRLKHLEGR